MTTDDFDQELLVIVKTVHTRKFWKWMKDKAKMADVLSMKSHNH
jgi:hypothetical protein